MKQKEKTDRQKGDFKGNISRTLNGKLMKNGHEERNQTAKCKMLSVERSTVLKRKLYKSKAQTLKTNEVVDKCAKFALLTNFGYKVGYRRTEEELEEARFDEEVRIIGK